MKIELGFRNWADRYARLLCGISLAVAIFLMYMVTEASIKIVLISMFLLGIMAFVKVKLTGLWGKIITIFTSIILALITLIFSNLIMGVTLSAMRPRALLMNIILYLCIAALFYAVTRKNSAAHILAMVLFLGLQTANAFIYSFRGSELAATDFLSLRSAMNVATNYKPVVTPVMVYAFAAVLIISYGLLFVLKDDSKEKQLGRPAASILALILALVFTVGIQDLDVRHFAKSGTITNGYMVNFILGLSELHVDEPENYSMAAIQAAEEAVTESRTERVPDIIVIMNESFSDLNVVGSELQPSQDELAFYRSIQENTIKGYALSSVYGGSTANSEWEFLTGNSMAFLPIGVVSYQQYIQQPAYSLVSALKSKGYYCMSMHPYTSNGWMRTTVYPLFGFDKSLYIEDFPQEKMIRDYVSDYEMYEQIIVEYENRNQEQPFFCFGVTMQNHGGYDDSDYESTVKIAEMSGRFPDVEQYLSLIRESDKALRQLIEYFANQENDTVILIFGDHQPSVDSEFLELAHGGAFSTLDEQEQKYMIPFLVWANYDIAEQNVSCTSINYLSNYLFKAAQLEIPAYNQILMKLEDQIPAINTWGYFSPENGRFMELESATGLEKTALETYRCLQYNAIFDAEGRSDVFFPSWKTKE